MKLTFDLVTAGMICVVAAPIGFGLLFAVLRLRRLRRAQSAIRRVMEG